MPARSSWKGYIKLSLISVPVKAYTATSSGGSVSLNQLHEECHSRVKYKKVCPIHGEVTQGDIVSGYEYSKGQYVIIDPDEIQALRSESDKSLNLVSFVPPDTIDAAYMSGRTYFLVPDGAVGQKPFQLLRHAMLEEGVHGVAQIVLSNREAVVRLRPVDDLLAMDVMQYKTQVKDAGSFRDEVIEAAMTDEELQLARQLISALQKEQFEPGEFEDLYTVRLTQLIEAKVEGKELVSPPAEDEPQVINLMDALRASVQQVGSESAAQEEGGKPPARKAASAKKRGTKKTTKKKSAKSG